MAKYRDMVEEAHALRELEKTRGWAWFRQIMQTRINEHVNRMSEKPSEHMSGKLRTFISGQLNEGFYMHNLVATHLATLNEQLAAAVERGEGDDDE